MRKVQDLAVFAALAALAAVVACNGPPGAEDGPENSGFGSPYEIVTNPTPAAPDESPAVASDSLLVLVRYAGGCVDHDFDLIASVSGDSAEVRLVHDDGGDECEALISERLRLAVPERVLSASRIHLRNPNSDVPFILRWDAPGSGR
jgi:hypothetical protein